MIDNIAKKMILNKNTRMTSDIALTMLSHKNSTLIFWLPKKNKKVVWYYGSYIQSLSDYSGEKCHDILI